MGRRNDNHNTRNYKYIYKVIYCHCSIIDNNIIRVVWNIQLIINYFFCFNKLK